MSTTRRAWYSATVLLIAALCGAVWWGTSRPRSDTGAASIRGSSVRSSDALEVPPVAGRALTAIEVRSPVPAHSPLPGGDGVSELRERVGRVVLVDESGAERDASGRLRVDVSGAGATRKEQVIVEGGRFEIDAEVGSSVMAWGGVLDDRPAAGATMQASARVPAEGEFQLLLQSRPGLTLHVIDAESREHLHGLEWRFRAGWSDLSSDSRGVPANLPTSSPAAVDDLAVQFDLQSGSLCVRAPGHAWAELRVGAEQSGLHVLALAKGADLEVRTAGDAPPPGAWLRLYSGSPERILLQQPAETSAAVVLDGIPAGPVRVAVEASEWPSTPWVFGATEVELVAGERALATVTVDVPAPSSPAPLAGVVVLPPEWGIAPVRLVLERDGPSPAGGPGEHAFESSRQPSAGTEDVFEFRAGDVVPGDYVLHALEPPGRIRLTVPPEGLTTARLVLAPPGELLVRFLDAETRAPLRPDTAFWSPAEPGPARSAQGRELRFDEALDAFSIRAPLGEVEVSVFEVDPEHEHAGTVQLLEVRPGRHVATVPLHRRLLVPLRVLAAGRELGFGELQVRVRPIDGSSHSGSLGYSQSQSFVSFEGAGRFGISLGDVQGFVTPEERVVDLSAGVPEAIVFELERRP
ncbi:MAG TPA: hypothetical protein VJP77_02340 [Planctomycetota bacterium]|nr:hypothetical protein [Planctomycetota bacterium]